jgi:hypothetical protein
VTGRPLCYKHSPHGKSGQHGASARAKPIESSISDLTLLIDGLTSCFGPQLTAASASEIATRLKNLYKRNFGLRPADDFRDARTASQM